MTRFLLPLTLLLALAVFGLAVWGLWELLTPHGVTLFLIGLATLGALEIYVLSQVAFVKWVAVALFDVVLPALLAIPLFMISLLQLAAGRWWLALGRAQRL